MQKSELVQVDVDHVLKRDVRTIRFVVTVFIVNKLLVYLPTIVALIDQNPFRDWSSIENLKFLISDNFNRWDAIRFKSIAERGYSVRNTAFFPLYPLLISFLMNVTGRGFESIGFIVSNLAFLITLYFTVSLLELDFQPIDAKRIIWLIGLFPTSFYFSAQYTESLFFMFFVMTLYGLRTNRFFLSACTGCLAAATRNVGVFLTIPYLLESFQIIRLRDVFEIHKKFKPQYLIQARWGIIIPISLFLYMAYLTIHFHDPLSFTHAEKFWGRAYHNPLDTIYTGCKDYFENILNPTYTWKPFGYQAINTFCVLLDLLIIIAGFRKMRFSYWIILLYSVLIPLTNPIFKGNDYFMSITRYSLVVLPLYIGLYQLVKNFTWIYYSILLVYSVMLMILMYVWTLNIGFIA